MGHTQKLKNGFFGTTEPGEARSLELSEIQEGDGQFPRPREAVSTEALDLKRREEIDFGLGGIPLYSTVRGSMEHRQKKTKR